MVATVHQVQQITAFFFTHFSVVLSFPITPPLSFCQSPPNSLHLSPTSCLTDLVSYWKLSNVTAGRILLNEQGIAAMLHFPLAATIYSWNAEMLQTNSDAAPPVIYELHLCWFGAWVHAYICVCDREDREDKEMRVCELPRGAYRARVWTRPVYRWSYWGYFVAASLTFWRHFTKGLSHHSELSDHSLSTHLKQFYQRLL